jgi:hypothetical protein
MTEQPNPLPDGVGDFWLFDSTTPARFEYSDGKVVKIDVLPDEDGPDYVAYRDVALAHAVPFDEWWAMHGE